MTVAPLLRTGAGPRMGGVCSTRDFRADSLALTRPGIHSTWQCGLFCAVGDRVYLYPAEFHRIMARVLGLSYREARGDTLDAHEPQVKRR